MSPTESHMEKHALLCRYIRLVFLNELVCKLKYRLREVTSCWCSAAALAICFEGRVAGLDAAITGNKLYQLKFEFTSLLINASSFLPGHPRNGGHGGPDAEDQDCPLHLSPSQTQERLPFLFWGPIQLKKFSLSFGLKMFWDSILLTWHFLSVCMESQAKIQVTWSGICSLRSSKFFLYWIGPLNHCYRSEYCWCCCCCCCC